MRRLPASRDRSSRASRTRALCAVACLLPSSPASAADAPLYPPLFFFFNDTATTEISPLSLHDALPICCFHDRLAHFRLGNELRQSQGPGYRSEEHTSELQSPSFISYAVFCLKKNISPDSWTRVGPLCPARRWMRCRWAN